MTEKAAHDHYRFPIRELSARTQVNTVTLRAWERRYGLLKPQRTEKGHRLYSEQDVNAVEKILALVARGVPLGKVKRLLHADTPVAIEDDKPYNWNESVTRLLGAVECFSANKVEHLISELFANFPAQVCRQYLLNPAFAALGQLNDAKAAYGFAESELIRYAALRLNSRLAKQQRGAPLVLMCGEQTPLWHLAAIAMELADAQFSVLLMNRPFSVEAGLIVADSLKDATAIFYQDGVWRDKEIDKVRAALLSNQKLMLCGTAPALAELGGGDRVFSSLESGMHYLLKSQ